MTGPQSDSGTASSGPRARRGRPALAVAALALAAAAVFAVPAPASGAAPGTRHVHIDARAFEYAPAMISVNPGDIVTLELASTDVVHGLYLDGYDLDVTADPGQPAELTFVADRTGTFRFRCSVTCGPLHPFMVGELHVGPDWRLWRAVAAAGLAAVAGLVWVRPRQ